MTLATLDGFLSNPLLVWNNYRIRLNQVSNVQPNPAHITLAEMERYYPEFLLATQNVDDLHERAGSRKMVKIHGSINQVRCTLCDEIFSADDYDMSKEFTSDTLPHCLDCGGLCRPNIVWFGEYVPQKPLMSAIESASKCDLMLVVGTSGEVSNGYGLAEHALANGAKIVEINPNEGFFTHYAHFWIPEPAGAALPRIWNIVKNSIGGPRN